MGENAGNGSLREVDKKAKTDSDLVLVLLGHSSCDGRCGHVKQKVEHHSCEREADARNPHCSQLSGTKAPNERCNDPLKHWGIGVSGAFPRNLNSLLPRLPILRESCRAMVVHPHE